MTPPLTPMSLGTLAQRVHHEWTTRQKIFDLPSARIWSPDPDIDLGFEFLGRRCSSPIGPAAGPHSQMAQNLVLAWLGGSRLFELKTVQVIDDLDIARPCIDMQTIGYNIEWSQELTVPDSLIEYVTASMMIELLTNWEPLRDRLGNPGDHVFDMSVGYDLAGIQSDKIDTFLRDMGDATVHVDALRGQLAGGPFAELADLEFRTRIADTLTLSTFHGCPPDEIESITKHLIDAHDLDVIVKLNPTLLGYERVASIVNDHLGYDDVSVKSDAFAADLQFDRAIDLIGGLRDYAAARGRRFGIKLTNTLVVNNTKGWMPDDPMYLSGPPLHVIAMSLLAELADALPGVFDIPGHDGDTMVSFSAGITKSNIADALAAGVNPATICSDLLKPGGYGRLAPTLKSLTAAVADAGATSLGEYRALRLRDAAEAGYGSTCAEYAARLNGDGAAPYAFTSNSKLPRSVDNELQMFECVACNFCVTVCPNDAFFSVPSLDGQQSRQQYVVYAELCNECGNCMTFCPEVGDPAITKPRLYLDREVYEGRSGQGFLVSGADIHDSRAVDDSAVDVVRDLLGQPRGVPTG